MSDKNLSRYKIVKLVDTHNHWGADPSTLDYDNKDYILGHFTRGDYTTLVALSIVGYWGHLSINNVFRGDDDRLFLSTYSNYSLDPKQLKKLLTDGELTIKGLGPYPSVRFEVMKADEELPI